MSAKVIIVTGASRGIGLAVTNYLLRAPQSHRLVLLARSQAPLEDLQKQHPDRVQAVAGDLLDSTLPHRAIDVAVNKWGRLDGLVLNHGTIAVDRIAESNVEEWQRVMGVNLLSCVDFIRLALPHLRSSKGRIILTSSGAAVHAYATWGAYGASKAALNHVAMTLAVEEPDVVTVSVRPGVVDTDMQRELRDVHIDKMVQKDRDKFLTLKREGKLLKPEQPGNVMARLVLEAGKELSGKFISWESEELAKYQDTD